MIETLHELPRGCGYRKPGGLYLIGGGNAAVCCKLPAEISECKCCGNKIKQTRGWQWLPTNFFQGDCAVFVADNCPLSTKDSQVLLMWVGEKYYPNVSDFENEAAKMGISKRIPNLPKDFKPGTWVALAHPKGIFAGSPDYHYKPAIFMLFKPTRIEYVVKGDETESELNEFEAKGITPVTVVPVNPAGQFAVQELNL